MLTLIGWLAILLVGLLLVARAMVMAWFLRAFTGSWLGYERYGQFWLVTHLAVGIALLLLAHDTQPFSVSFKP